MGVKEPEGVLDGDPDKILEGSDEIVGIVDPCFVGSIDSEGTADGTEDATSDGLAEKEGADVGKDDSKIVGDA